MAAVIYECLDCLRIWADEQLIECKFCKSQNIQFDWVEENDFDDSEGENNEMDSESNSV